ncbi:MAG: NAD-dependent epimerase/dehydratase family protein [Patescibacteria group bacterium]
MKILVTGAAGFVGSHLAERLSEKGHEVVGLDCFTPYYSRDLKELNVKSIKEKGCRFLECDLTIDNLSDATFRVDVVYHLAAQPGISSSTAFESYERNNVIATFKLLEACQSASDLKCFVNIATSSIYGKIATESEEASPKPTSFYGVTKLAAEQLVLAYNRDKGFPATSVRLFSVYGERERPEKLYPKLIKSILEGSEFPLFEGSEKHQRSYTYVSDIIDGLELVLKNKDKCIGEILNLGCDTATITGDNIKIVENILGRKAKIVLKPKRLGDQEKTKANINKARKLLGYEPKVLPKDGLRREVLWYKEHVYGKIKDLLYTQ